MRVQELVRHLEDDGWTKVKAARDVRQLTSPMTAGVVTILGDDRLEVPTGTLRSVFAPVEAGKERLR